MAATMTMDNSRQHHFSNGHMSYDANQSNMGYSTGPQFTNPVWNSQQPSTAPLYTPMAPHSTGADSLPRPGFAKQSNAGLPGYPSMLNTSNTSLSYGQQQQNYNSAEQPQSEAYSATAPPQHYTSSSPSHYNMSGYNQIRRPSLQPGSLPPAALPPSSTFGDPLDMSRGALMQHAGADITPRNVYGGHPNERYADSYGFPAPQSTHSSISAASSAGYPYYAGSVDSSATDYSSADSVDSYHSRGMPRLSGPHAMLPPAPATMMGQFNSKTVSNAQKKHKCKVCDKRFTRPSSLQTHMYSHTGEKPFACDVAGCGRQFSVVSNLRRHKKVHKGGAADEHEHTENESHDSHSEHEHASPTSTNESWIKSDSQ